MPENKKRGYWEEGCAVDSKGNIVYESIDCSECFNIFIIKDHDAEYWKNKFKYCPFCGAVMNEGKELGK